VVVAGLATTVVPVVADNPVAGLQTYVTAPLAVSVTFPPAQIVADVGEMLTVGGGLGDTATKTVLVF
jgi:hypothetical protein